MAWGEPLDEGTTHVFVLLLCLTAFKNICSEVGWVRGGNGISDNRKGNKKIIKLLEDYGK